jgi:cell division protein FtsB
MVTRTRLRAVLSALGLYTVAGLIVGYFGLSAYTGAHGLKAKQDLTQQQASLMREIERTRAERLALEQKVSLLRPTISIPTCWMSAPARCSTTCTRATSR